jgi:NADH dehydrogenase
MNRLVKGGLVLGGLVLGLGALRRALNPTPRYAPWERPPYSEFEKKILILGGGFGGYTAATDVCKLTKGRDDVGVLL